MNDIESKKCDKGLFLENNDVYLVELKGVDFNTACKQLLVTLDFCKQNLGSYNYFCRGPNAPFFSGCNKTLWITGEVKANRKIIY